MKFCKICFQLLKINDDYVNDDANEPLINERLHLCGACTEYVGFLGQKAITLRQNLISEKVSRYLALNGCRYKKVC